MNALIDSILIFPKMLALRPIVVDGLVALGGKVLGMALVMKGKHLCKTMRGVRNDGNMTVAHLRGIFKTNKDCRDEFYKLIDLQG